MVFDLKVDTYRAGERLLPMPCVASKNLSDINYQHVCSAILPRQLESNYHDNRFFLRYLFRENFLRCRPFVHLMTATNTMNYIMKIPKAVVSSLKSFVDVPMNASVTIEALNESLHVITPSSYTLCKQDGRMVIEKSTFSDFISAASLVKDNVVLITFKEHKDRSVSIVFQKLI